MMASGCWNQGQRRNAFHLRTCIFYAGVCYVTVLVLKFLAGGWSQLQIFSGECPFHFAGGSPNIDGSCWCGKDRYCMCTPSLAIDCIIEYYDEEDAGEKSIVLVERGTDPPGYAIVGGFVEVGESTDSATIREVKEETGLTINVLQQFRFYSDPRRDPRRHTASLVYIAQASGPLLAGDDAKRVIKVKAKNFTREKILSMNFAFDHAKILVDYLDFSSSQQEPLVDGTGHLNDLVISNSDRY